MAHGEKNAPSEAALRDALTDKEWSAPPVSDKKEAVRLRAAAGRLRLSSLAAKSKAAPRKSARL